MKDLFALVSALEAKGIELASLTESIDTSTSAGKLFFYIFSAIAEFDKNLIIDRTRADLVAARARVRTPLETLIDGQSIWAQKNLT